MFFVPKGKNTSDLKMILLPLKAFILLELLDTLRYVVWNVEIIVLKPFEQSICITSHEVKQHNACCLFNVNNP